MGYYTNYVLWIENEDEFEPDLEMRVIENLARISNYWNETDLKLAATMSNPLSLVSYESIKWYDHVSDMLEVSKIFPECKFILEGQGEESEHMWREYYYNGHIQFAPARIEYDKPAWDSLATTNVNVKEY